MPKNSAAVALGRLGGSVRGVKKGYAVLSPEERAARAREGALARWAKARQKKKKKSP